MTKKLPALAIFTVLTFTNCMLTANIPRPVEIIVRTPSFNIAWEPPPRTDIKSTLTAYKLYCTEYDRTASMFISRWCLLSTIPASEYPVFTIDTEILDLGQYAFAVTAVYENGTETAKHISTESTADPPSGWYVLWIGTQ